MNAFYKCLILFNSLYQFCNKSQMGNYCCNDDEPAPLKLKLKKRASLIDPSVRKEYQQKISQVLNRALTKFNEEKKVDRIQLKSMIGRGGQGDVLLADVQFSDKDDDVFTKEYAIKRVSKSNLNLQRTKQALILENQILASHDSDFLTHIKYAFQDDSYLYYMMDVARGGDLFGYIYPTEENAKQKCGAAENLGEEGIKFIIAGVILGLEYLNRQGIIYRDLKPENILIYEDGYPKLADFGVIHRFQENKLCYDIKGTALYFSPEMVFKLGYDRAHDLWTLGVLIYELLFKKVPFTLKMIQSRKFLQILRDWESKPEIMIKPASPEIINLIQSLLKTSPKQRLGYESYDEIKNHQFFKDFDWNKYEKKQMKSPFSDIVADYPITFKAITQEIDELSEDDKNQRIPFTFVRDQRTRANSFDRLNRLSSQQDDSI